MMKNELQIIGRSKSLYDVDLLTFNDEINDAVRGSSFLVVGAAGTIGQAVTKEIFKEVLANYMPWTSVKTTL